MKLFYKNFVIVDMLYQLSAVIEYSLFKGEDSAAEASCRNVLKGFCINFHAAVDKVNV